MTDPTGGDTLVSTLAGRNLGAGANVTIGGAHYAVYQLESGDYRATEGVCTHEFALLADGMIQDGCVSCPKHNAKYDVCSGKVLTRPGKRDLRTYPVKVEDDTVYIQV